MTQRRGMGLNELIKIFIGLLFLSTIRIVNSLKLSANTTGCPKIKSGNVAYSTIKSNGFQDKSFPSPLVDYRYAYEKLGERHVVLRHVLVNYPFQTLSVLEPWQPGGCHLNRTLVKKTLKYKSCEVAMNAGFFYEYGEEAGCYGNIVSDGRLVRESGGIQNAYFGIKENGDVFMGYLTEADVAREKFIQLVSGVIWLIRDGKVNINNSVDYECPDALQGPIQNFSSTLSARSAVAVDRQGRVILLQVDGNTHERGINLFEFADMMLKYGVVQAVNLDGGGSSSLLINGTLVNNPPDICKDDARFRCPRPVSTILCVHNPVCDPPGCSGHGQCINGKCQCYYPWSGQDCSTLKCDKNCSFNGICIPSGCACSVGFQTLDRSQQYPEGPNGIGCSNVCLCLNGTDGSCNCAAGYIEGACAEVYQCLVDGFIEKEKHVGSDYTTVTMMTIALVVLGLERSISTIINILLLYRLFVR